MNRMLRLIDKHKEGYSPNEQRILDLLDFEFISSVELIEKFYRGRKPRFNAREIVTGAIDRLARKLDWNNDPLEIERTPTKPMMVRLRERVARKKRRKKNEVRSHRSANDASGVRRRRGLERSEDRRWA